MNERNKQVISRREVLGTALAGAGLALGGGLATAQSDNPPRTRPIPSSGELLPVIGLGTNAYSVTAAEELAARRAVLARMSALGGTLVDTARAYGESETVLGGLIDELGLRKQLFVATKTPMSGDFTQADRLLDEALLRLKTRTLDLMQVHNLAGTAELLPAFRRWKERGTIRYYGITTSNDEQYPAMVELLRRERLDFIQVDYSIANRGAAQEILPLAAERGVAVLINMPFGGRRGGNLFARLGDRPLPDWAAEFDAASWAEFLLKYCLAHPAVTCLIPGTTKVANLETNQRAARGRLPDAAMRTRMEQYWDQLAPANAGG